MECDNKIAVNTMENPYSNFKLDFFLMKEFVFM